MATFNALAHRLTNVPMDIEDYNDEINIIKHIAIVNAVSYTHLDVYKRQVSTHLPLALCTHICCCLLYTSRCV